MKTLSGAGLAFLVPVVVINLQACVGSKPLQQTDTNPNIAISKQLSAHRLKNAAPTIDLYSLDYGPSNSLEVCNSSSTICAKLDKIPYATFAQLGPETQEWVIPNYLSKIHISFKNGIPAGFHISDIYNNLSNNNQVAGKISQINTSDCDKAVSSAVATANSCDILFTYHGVTKDNTTLNTINLKFTATDSNADFILKFPVQNKSLSQTFPQAIASAPLLALKEDAIKLDVPPSLSYDDEDIIFNTQFTSQIAIKNLGTASVEGVSGKPTISIAFGNASDVGGIAPSLSTFYFNNDDAYSSTCEDQSIASGTICYYPFTIVTPTTKLTSSLSYVINNFLIQYNIGNGVTLNYVAPFSLTYGDLKQQDYYLSRNDEHTIATTVNKFNISGATLRYDEPVNNLKFTSQFNPAFAIDTEINEDSHRLNYGYGDILDKDNHNKPIAITEALSWINFNFDNDCFTQGYDPTNNSQQDFSSSITSCALKFTLPNFNKYDFLNKPLAFQLMATYTEPTGGNVAINQAIGSVVVANMLGLPYGDYRDSCSLQSTSWNKEQGLLNTECRTDSQLMANSALDYKNTCTSGSYIHNAKGVAICSSPKLSVATPPAGSYQQSCVNIYWDGKSLYAECNDGTFNSGVALKWINSSIDMTTCDSKFVENSNGKLVCSSKLAAPVGIYQKECDNIKWEPNSGIITARCSIYADDPADRKYEVALGYYDSCNPGSEVFVTSDNGATKVRLECISAKKNSPDLPSTTTAFGGLMDYTKRCNNIHWDGKIFVAQCSTNPDSNGNCIDGKCSSAWTSLDYSQCNSGDAIGIDPQSLLLNCMPTTLTELIKHKPQH